MFKIKNSPSVLSIVLSLGLISGCGASSDGEEVLVLFEEFAQELENAVNEIDEELALADFESDIDIDSDTDSDTDTDSDSDSDSETSNSTNLPGLINPTGIISRVAVGDIEGLFYAGSSPDSTGTITLEPLIDSDEPIQIISGGSTQLPIDADEPFSTIYVVADDEGYFEINLPEETVESDVIISYSTIQLDGEEVSIDAQVATATGNVSEAQQLSVTSVVVGTGELQVSVSWDTPTDVDLYLTEPNGTTIDFSNEESFAGGVLDLDSNVICIIDNINNENITYENVTPPSGEYLVELDYYSSCSIAGNTNYVVTVRNNGRVQTFSGTLTNDDGRVSITTFEVQ